jgi:HTH-type transcriptional regulator/antitoxin HigA
MNQIKVIRTEQDYEEALKLIEVLMDGAPDPESENGEKLSLLVTLVKDYESRVFPIDLPDPIEAIKFKLEQNNLKPNALIPFIGSRSRVSEILSGKRQLTVEMMRSLEAGLGIPAHVLLKKPKENQDAMYTNWNPVLLKEIEARGYFGSTTLKKTNADVLVERLLSSIELPSQMLGMLRQTNYRSSPLTDKRALTAWSIFILKKAKKINTKTKYKKGTVNLAFMQKLATLSVEKNGPILAQEYLKKHGIALVIEPHFSKTYLDGATILINKSKPVIGLTLRYDRLDNFWFTLMHELAHIALHYDQNITLFYDEIEGVNSVNLSQIESDADRLAQEALLPESKWEVSPAKLVPSSMAAKSLAHDLGVHAAIIAGQMRHRGKTYAYLSKIVNEERVRKYFTNEKWPK